MGVTVTVEADYTIHNDGVDCLCSAWDGADLLVREYGGDGSYQQLRVPAEQFGRWSKMLREACSALPGAMLGVAGWRVVVEPSEITVVPPIQDRLRYASPIDTTSLIAPKGIWGSILDEALARAAGIAAPTDTADLTSRLFGARSA